MRDTELDKAEAVLDGLGNTCGCGAMDTFAEPAATHLYDAGGAPASNIFDDLLWCRCNACGNAWWASQTGVALVYDGAVWNPDEHHRSGAGMSPQRVWR